MTKDLSPHSLTNPMAGHLLSSTVVTSSTPQSYSHLKVKDLLLGSMHSNELQLQQTNNKKYMQPSQSTPQKPPAVDDESVYFPIDSSMNLSAKQQQPQFFGNKRIASEQKALGPKIGMSNNKLGAAANTNGSKHQHEPLKVHIRVDEDEPVLTTVNDFDLSSRQNNSNLLCDNIAARDQPLSIFEQKLQRLEETLKRQCQQNLHKRQIGGDE